MNGWLHRAMSRPVVIGAVVAAMGLGALYVMTRPASTIATQAEPDADSPRSRESVIGGVSRPESDFRRKASSESKADVNRTHFRYGKIPPVEKATNPTVQSAFDAVSNPVASEAATANPLMAPVAFDKNEYDRDRQQYIAKFAPGRVWQAAQPGEGVPVLQRSSARLQTLKQGESVRLKAQAGAGNPVTFTTFDTGSFTNKLPSMTVVADDAGIAEVVYTATTGTIARVNVLAASPLASGRVDYELMVLPNQTNEPSR